MTSGTVLVDRRDPMLRGRIKGVPLVGGGFAELTSAAGVLRPRVARAALVKLPGRSMTSGTVLVDRRDPMLRGRIKGVPLVGGGFAELTSGTVWVFTFSR